MGWHNEPNRLDWQASGYPCLVVRHASLLHLCGYVAVPPGHPWHGLDYDSIEPYPDIHGGLTFAEDHPPLGEPDSNWWLGFDCAHAGDLVPGMMRHAPDDEYRDFEFVCSECEHLVEQAVSAASGMSPGTAETGTGSGPKDGQPDPPTAGDAQPPLPEDHP